MATKRILAFAPYGTWSVHHQLDAVVGTALRMRGADVRVLLCDGLFRDCLLAGKPHDPEACRTCELSGKQFFKGFPLETRQIFAHLKPADFADAEEWSASVPVSGHASAVYEGVPVGQLVRGSLHTYCMTGRLDYTLAHTLSTSRNFLYNGALLVRAVRSHLREYRPDHVLCFNAVHAFYRIFFAICRTEGIPVLVHEAGLTAKDFSLFPNFSNFDHKGRQAVWEPWMPVPLDRGQCLRVKDYFDEREKSIKSGAVTIYPFETDPLKVKQALRIPEGRKVVGAFTSSDWEVGIAECNIDLTFATQIEWLRETARICAAEGHFLIIRHHPNNARKEHFCGDFLQEVMQLNAEFGDNVRVVMPSEKVTSYGLLWNLDLAVSFITTMGAEASIRGVPSICVADSLYRHMGMDYVRDRAGYAEAIRRGLARPASKAMEDLRMAYRSGHHLYFGSGYDFKAFGIKNNGMDLRIREASDLAAGGDPVLDAVCAHILSGAPLRVPPPPGPDGYDSSVEDGFLRAEQAALDVKRAKVRSHSEWSSGNERLITVMRGTIPDESGDPRNWKRQAMRSRHKRLQWQDVALQAGMDTRSRLEAVSRALESADGEFAYVGTPNLILDECVFSASADLLCEAANAGVPAVSWGAWVCGPEGKIVDDVFARPGPMEWADAVKSTPLVLDPFNLLGLLVVRTEQLKKWVREWAAARWEEPGQLAALIFETCLAEGSACHSMRAPLLWLHPDRSEIELPLADMAFVYRMTGDLGRAGELYLAALNENPGDDMLADEYFKVMQEMGKADEARRRLGARGNDGSQGKPSVAVSAGAPMPGLRIGPPNEGWLPAGPVMPPEASPSPGPGPKAPNTYAEIADKVETVKGWLLEGQEKYLFDKVKSLPDGACILEMGANFGRSTCAMAFACLGTKKHIYSVDTFSGNDGVMGRAQDFHPIWYGNLQRLGLESYATALRGFTFDVLTDRSRFPAPLFVFIDASHEYFDVLQDFKDIYDYVPEGGWIAFHDVEVNWPGPWRVWMDYAAHLLTDHQYVATLACGRKSVAKAFGRAPGAALGFSYAEAFMREFEGRYTPASPLCQALRTSFLGRVSTQAERDALSQAEVRIAEAPEADFRSGLVNIMSVKDGGMDGHIRFWYGLTLIADGKIEDAYLHLREAGRVSYPIPQARTAPYLALIRENAKGPLPEGEEPAHPWLSEFRQFVGPGDTVIALRSGEGDLLRGISCARKVGIEKDRESRKAAVVKFGIDGAEELSELPDACAEALLCADGLEKSPAPLETLRTAAAKLKPRGKAVFTVPAPSAPVPDALYCWTPASLANLFRAAGFDSSLTSVVETRGRLLIAVEKR